MKLKQLVIDRKRWIRGDGWGSMLYREEDRKMCCVGFYCRQVLHMPVKAIRNKRVLDGPDLKESTHYTFSHLYDINDNGVFKGIEREREELIKKHFLDLNVEVTFIN